jgi:UDP-glucuronate 4-epimerase
MEDTRGMTMTARILLTGCAGFIGFHTTLRFLQLGHTVHGVDSMEYDTEIARTMKEDRMEILREHTNFSFTQGCISDEFMLDEIFRSKSIDYVIHLAAKAGVRSPPDAAMAYVKSNLLGFGNVISCCKRYNVKHLMYASSSSVYGGAIRAPNSEDSVSDDVQNLYAATKRSNELIARAFATSFNVPSIGLRFFTVYGPWSRPDMAVFSFARKIMNNEAINLYGNGELLRDFTYIGDVVDALERIFNKINQERLSNTEVPNCRILNVGRGEPRTVAELVEYLENYLSTSANTNLVGRPVQDVVKTHADLKQLNDFVGAVPQISLEEGIERFCNWFVPYYSQLSN